MDAKGAEAPDAKGAEAHKKSICLLNEDGNTIQVFDSLTEAAIFAVKPKQEGGLGLDYKTWQVAAGVISKVARGKRNTAQMSRWAFYCTEPTRTPANAVLKNRVKFAVNDQVVATGGQYEGWGGVVRWIDAEAREATVAFYGEGRTVNVVWDHLKAAPVPQLVTPAPAQAAPAADEEPPLKGLSERPANGADSAPTREPRQRKPSRKIEEAAAAAETAAQKKKKKKEKKRPRAPKPEKKPPPPARVLGTLTNITEGQPAAEAAKAPPEARKAKRKAPEPESVPPPTPVLRGGGVEHTVVAAAGVIVNTTSGPRKYLEVGTKVTECFVPKAKLREGECKICEPVDGWVPLESLGLSDDTPFMKAKQIESCASRLPPPDAATVERWKACGARVALPSRPLTHHDRRHKRSNPTSYAGKKAAESLDEIRRRDSASMSFESIDRRSF